MLVPEVSRIPEYKSRFRKKFAILIEAGDEHETIFKNLTDAVAQVTNKKVTITPNFSEMKQECVARRFTPQLIKYFTLFKVD